MVLGVGVGSIQKDTQERSWVWVASRRTQKKNSNGCGGGGE